MRTLLSQLLKNKTPNIRKRKRYCIDKKFNDEVKRYRRRQKTGIIIFIIFIIIATIAIATLAFGSIFGVATV